jgi:hypothetical protein
MPIFKASTPLSRTLDKARTFWPPCPESGKPRRSWLQGRARACETYGCTAEDATDILLQFCNGERREEAIANAVEFIYGEASAVREVTSDVKPDLEETERIVAAEGLTVGSLIESSSNRAKHFAQKEILAKLWRPRALICIGLTEAQPGNQSS